MTADTCDMRISLASPLVAEPQTALANSGFTANETQWNHVQSELLRLRRLEKDWDGQGALPPEPANVDQAMTWVGEMRRWHQALPPTGVFPGTLGEIVLEWRRGSFHLVAEISTPTRLEWLLNLPGQPARQWETDAKCLWIVRAEG